MTSEKFKSILFIIGFMTIGLILEFTRKAYGIPVTILDILLFPLSLIFTVLLLKDFFINQSKEKTKKSLKLKASAIAGRIAITLLLFFPLGIWAMWEGLKNPFGYFSGIKGAAHGYTLTAIGLFIFSLGIIFISSVIRNVLSVNKRIKER